MKQQTLFTNYQPKISIKTGGDLRLIAWNRDQVRAESGSEDLIISPQEDILQVSPKGNLTLFAPEKANVQVLRIGGDAIIKGIAGEIQIQRIGGSLKLFMVGKTVIKQVGSDFSACNVQGDLEVQRIGGDMHCQNVYGSVTSRGKLGSDVTLKNISGPVQLSTGGDIRFSSQIPDGEYSFTSGGDTTLFVPDEVNAAFDVISKGHNIKMHLAGTINDIGRREYQAVFGAGKAKIKIEAGADVKVFSILYEDMPKHDVFTRLEEEFSRLDEMIIQRMEAGLEAAKLSVTLAEKAALRSKEAVERVSRIAESRVQAALRQVEHLSSNLHKGIGNEKEEEPSVGDVAPSKVIVTPPPEAKAPSPTAPNEAVGTEPSRYRVTDEEKLIILQMVEKKKISVEEADQLLEVLNSMDTD